METLKKCSVWRVLFQIPFTPNAQASLRKQWTPSCLEICKGLKKWGRLADFAVKRINLPHSILYKNSEYIWESFIYSCCCVQLLSLCSSQKSTRVQKVTSTLVCIRQALQDKKNDGNLNVLFTQGKYAMPYFLCQASHFFSPFLSHDSSLVTGVTTTTSFLSFICEQLKTYWPRSDMVSVLERENSIKS